MEFYTRFLYSTAGITVFFTTHYIDEAERVADRVAIIDHGRLVAEDSPEELKKKNGAKTLEEAFLSLTGKKIREEEAGSIDQMRMRHRMWSKR